MSKVNVKMGKTYNYYGKKCKVIYIRSQDNFDIEFSDGSKLSGVHNVNLKEVSETKEEIHKELLELEKNFVNSRTELQNKLQYLEESGSEEFDENEFKVHTTLKTLENKKLSIKEKTKLIASLINQ